MRLPVLLVAGAMVGVPSAMLATRWVDGPELAELPGRLRTWRERMSRLARA